MSVGTQQVPMPWTPAPPQLVMAYSVCKGITRQNARNFYYGFLVLPRRKREALCAVYAFMRRCDDIADDPKLAPDERRRQLDLWLNALHRAQQGEPTDDAILLALTDAQRRYAIPAGLLDELAHGTAMDVEETQAAPNAHGITVHYNTFEDLRVYCYRVASVVGLVCIHIFGYRDPAAEPLAERCGLAFQLTNIIRDVKEDADMGRVYLPYEDLSKFGLTVTDVLKTDAARLRPVLALMADRARECYGAGDDLLSYISEDSQPALWVLVNIYRSLLEKISLKQYDVFTAKVALSTWEKLRILGKGFLKRIT